MIPRWLLFIGVILAIAWVWSRRQKAQLQLAAANPNWNKRLGDIGTELVDRFPVSSTWQNQRTSAAGMAEESFIPQMAFGWLDQLTKSITSQRKTVPAAGNNSDDYQTYDPEDPTAQYYI